MVSEPPFAQIVAAIRRRIETGELGVGDRVPSTRQITKNWGVAMATATKVLTTLRQEGLVVARPGIGTVVANPAPSRPAAAPRAQPRAVAPEITGEDVLRTAIRIADAEGAAALSMRRIAGELGVATMSLYRHVPSKDELVAQMVDVVFGDHRFTEAPPPDWRRALDMAARLLWTICRRHPWAAAALSLTRPRATPNTLAYAEWVLSALNSTGLDGYRIFQVHLTLFSYVRGTAVNLELEAAAEQETGQTYEQFLAAQDTAFTAMITSGAYPTFVDVAARANFDLDLDELFEFGLRNLLDGFAAVFPVDSADTRPSAGGSG